MRRPDSLGHKLIGGLQGMPKATRYWPHELSRPEQVTD